MAPFTRPERFANAASIFIVFWVSLASPGSLGAALGLPLAPFGLPVGSLWLLLAPLLLLFRTPWLLLGFLGVVFG